MTHIEYLTPDGIKKEPCKDLLEALEVGYIRATQLPLDPACMPVVRIFDRKGFVIKIDKLDILKRQ